jgi:hypothetical protein
MSVEFNTGTLTTPQLEKGSTATSFDYRPYGTELSLCQRYYETGGVIFGNRYSNQAGSFAATEIYFAVTKRAAPTMSFSGVTYAACSALIGNSTVDRCATTITLAGAAVYLISAGSFQAAIEL